MYPIWERQIDPEGGTPPYRAAVRGNRAPSSAAGGRFAARVYDSLNCV